jgi:hypothetical protein
MAGPWYIVVPEAGTNLVVNPSWESGVANWTNSNLTTYERVTTKSAFGAYSAHIADTVSAGAEYLYSDAITVTAGTTYTLSLYVQKAVTNTTDTGTVLIRWRDAGAATISDDTYTLTAGDLTSWTKVVLTATAPASSVTALIIVNDTGIASGDWEMWLDGVQFEAAAYATSYIDGDQDGCEWTGTAHASTSTRDAAGPGGRVVDIDETYDTFTTGMVGFGMPPITHNSALQALTPGGIFQSIKIQPRVLQLRIGFHARTNAAYHAVRKLILSAVAPNYGGTLQPVELRYDGAGSEVRIYGYYDAGLEGAREMDGSPPEAIMLRMICYDPFWRGLLATTVALTTVSAISDADYVLRRNDGVWANVSGDFNQFTQQIIEDSAGNIYISGLFTDVGDANGDYVVMWDPKTNTLSSLSTGASSYVRAMAAAPDGTIYLGGNFTDLGDANGDRIIKWDGTNWTSLSTGIDNGYVKALVVGNDGTLYIGGAFADFGDANGDCITSWNGTAFASLGTGMAGPTAGDVNALVIGPDGYLYAAGQFTTAGGVAAAGIAKWDGSAWSAVGSGTGVGGAGGGADYGVAIAFGPDGTLYMGGYFTTVDGISAPYIAKFNGTSWSGLGSGMNATVREFAFGPGGELYVAGAFTQAGDLATAQGLALWNGSTWSHVGVTLPGAPTAYSLLVTGDDLYIGYDGSGTAYAAAQTTVTNSGSAVAYPTITIKRSGGTLAQVQYLKNETTGKTLYLNYSLLDGETLTIRMTPGAKTITSDYSGNVIGRALLPNSDFSEFALQPGANVISLYVYQTGSPTMTARCTFYEPHWSPDSAD